MHAHICTMSIADNLKSIQQSIPESVKLVAVSKTHSAETVMEAYNAGHRHFGENKVQEMVAKSEEMPNDIHWHLIGHLQRNKVKYIAPFVHLIHGVDSLKLLKEINKRAAQNERVVDCLIQVFIAKEESKFGMDESELRELMQSETLAELNSIRITGLMGMATNTDNLEQVRSEFTGLKNLYDELAAANSPENVQLENLSMGMSGDYEIAIDCGSNMIRVGSAIFGARNYG
ncbi:MAG: YggS family pyridoxal phosphate-dependent enzyme [Salibacteraceae bacterium]